MCGRYTLVADHERLAEEFELHEVESVRLRYNVAPTQMVPVIRSMGDDQRRELNELRWGLVPKWAKDPAIGNRMINARSEEAASKPSFRAPMRRQRCLVPSTGFFEWKLIGDENAPRPKKQPYYIRRRDERVFAFAGLWDRWKGPEGSTIESYAILTTEPNELMRPLHKRMPVIVRPDDYALWLDPKMQDVDRVQSVFRSYPSEELTAYPVSTRVNSPAHDDPACIQEMT